MKQKIAYGAVLGVFALVVVLALRPSASFKVVIPKKGADFSLIGVRICEISKGKKRWIVQAKQAELYKSDHIFRLESPHFQSLDPMFPITFSVESLVWDLSRERLWGSGNAKLEVTL